MHGVVANIRTPLTYRPEIDGLRALAVMSVILFHAGLGVFSGGYVGVDVFFVISGYLITSIIFTELENGKFSLRRFYERRARRILPALFLVMFACLPFAWLLMAPAQLRDFAKSVVAVSLFASNFFFWQESGYFTEALEEKPLLHTWSLAVEEQYYLIFPLITLLLWPFGKRVLWVLTFLAAVGSLAIAEFGWRHWPEANFYLLPSRAWELAIGGLAAFYVRDPLPLSKRFQDLASGVGLLIILATCVVFSKTTPFPSLYAAITVIGTFLVVVFAGPATLAGKLLSLKPFVSLGLISYSAYLWHQPLFAFTRILSPSKPTIWVMLVLAAISIGLAYLSWRFVESWFRYKANTRTLMGAAFACSICLVGIGTLFAVQDLSRKFTPEQLARMDPPNGNRDARRLNNCEHVSSSEFGFKICSQRPDLATKAVIYGDSHADALYLALSDELARSGIDLMILKEGRVGKLECQVFLGSYRVGHFPSEHLRNWCAERTREIGRIANTLDAKHLFLTFRWSFRLYPAGEDIASLDFDNGEGGVGGESHREFFVFDDRGAHSTKAADKFSVTVATLMSVAEIFKGTLILVGPVPEVGWRVANRNRTNIRIFGEVEPTISTSYELFAQRNQFVTRILDEVMRRAGSVLVVHPKDVFCGTFLASRCVAQFQGEPFYSDDDHLSAVGATLLSRHIVSKINRPSM
jgi:peptidoglycan/LPS O-acetylase OafA/YrhL